MVEELDHVIITSSTYTRMIIRSRLVLEINSEELALLH